MSIKSAIGRVAGRVVDAASKATAAPVSSLPTITKSIFELAASLQIAAKEKYSAAGAKLDDIRQRSANANRQSLESQNELTAHTGRLTHLTSQSTEAGRVGKDRKPFEDEITSLEKLTPSITSKAGRDAKVAGALDEDTTAARREFEPIKKTFHSAEYRALIAQGCAETAQGIETFRLATAYFVEHQRDLGSRDMDFAMPMFTRPDGAFDSVVASLKAALEAPTREEAGKARTVRPGNVLVQAIQPIPADGGFRTVSAYSIGERFDTDTQTASFLEKRGLVVRVDNSVPREKVMAPPAVTPLVPRKGLPATEGKTVRFVKSCAANNLFAPLGFVTGDRTTLESATADAVVKAKLAEYVEEAA